MKLLATSKMRKKAMELEVRGHGFITLAGQRFELVCPHGDDWQQTLKYELANDGVSVHWGYDVTVVFDSEEALHAFADWLAKANVQADEGYRTMRG